MKFVMMPTWPLTTPAYVERGDGSTFLALPMPGQRVTELAPLAGDNTIYPLVMTMEQLIKWWHRVRKWEIVANHPLWPVNQIVTLSLSETGSLGEQIVMNMPNGWNNVTSPDPNDWFAAGKWTGSFVWTDPSAVEHTAYFTLSILQKPSADILSSYYLTGDFTQILPYMRLTFFTDGIGGVFAYADSAAFYDTPPGDHPDIGDANGNASATIDGLAPLMTAAFFTGSGFEDDPMTLALTPSLYWAYAKPDGSDPTWNTTTGAKV